MTKLLLVLSTLWIAPYYSVYADQISLNELNFAPFVKSTSAVGTMASRSLCRAQDWAGVESVEGSVVRPVDGDTVIANLRGREYSIRMLSIDTPETHFQGRSQGYWGEEAARFLANQLMPGAAMKVEFDSEPCDRYGRLLGHVFRREGTNHWENVNRSMVAGGYAVNYCIYPNQAHCDIYGELAQAAHDAGRGFFGDNSTEIPYIWRQEQRNEAPTKYIGDIRTHETFQPGNFERVEIGARIFFMRRSDIRDPYESPRNLN